MRTLDAQRGCDLDHPSWPAPAFGSRKVSSSTSDQDLASYIRLGLNMVIRIIYSQPEVWLDLWGGTDGTYTGFDIFNRIIDQKWQNDITGTPTDIDRYKYGYDYNSNRLYKANVVGTPIVTGGLDEYYLYDNLNRLNDMQRGTLNGTNTGITGTPTDQQTWTLDITGNWSGLATLKNGDATMTQGRVSNAVNEITSITSVSPPPPPTGTATPAAWVTPLYDAAGNMTTMPQVVTPTSAFTATYDAWNRMVSIGDGGDIAINYQYDGRNRRIIRTTAGETRHFYFTSDWQDIEEQVGATSPTMDKQYVWGITYTNDLIGRYDASDNMLYALHDATFSVTALVSPVTMAVVERLLYAPYGTTTVLGPDWVSTSDTNAWQCRFQGGMVDSGTGLLSFGYRDLNPALGTWTARDPVGYLGDLSLYQMESSNPVLLLDPFGLAPDPSTQGWTKFGHEYWSNILSSLQRKVAWSAKNTRFVVINGCCYFETGRDLLIRRRYKQVGVQFWHRPSRAKAAAIAAIAATNARIGALAAIAASNAASAATSSAIAAAQIAIAARDDNVRSVLNVVSIGVVVIGLVGKIPGPQALPIRIFTIAAGLGIGFWARHEGQAAAAALRSAATATADSNKAAASAGLAAAMSAKIPLLQLLAALMPPWELMAQSLARQGAWSGWQPAGIRVNESLTRVPCGSWRLLPRQGSD
jgi:RHS repeat-associated protein